MKMTTRINKLIKPALQLRVALVFVASACISVIVLMILLNRAVGELVASGALDEAVAMARWREVLVSNLLFSLGILVPLSIGLGVMTSFRIAGPLHRFEEHLRKLAAGEQPGPCRIRKGDELQEFCELLNRVTLPMQGQTESSAPSEPAVERQAA